MERTHIVFVDGMTCGNCAARISKELDNTRVDYTINVENRSVSIKGDNDALHAAKLAINSAGYAIK